MTENTSKKRKWKKTLIAGAATLGLLATLFVAKYYVDVRGSAQQVLLWTGIVQPDMERPAAEREPVDIDMPLVSLSGEETNLNQFQGKVVFVNFWATWCAPCIEEMPNIQSLYERYEDNPDIAFLMVSVDEKADKARGFIQEKGFTFPVFMLDGKRPPKLQREIIPSTFVIDKQNRIAVSREGMSKYNTKRFNAFLTSLIAY